MFSRSVLTISTLKSHSDLEVNIVLHSYHESADRYGYRLSLAMRSKRLKQTQK